VTFILSSISILSCCKSVVGHFEPSSRSGHILVVPVGQIFLRMMVKNKLLSTRQCPPYRPKQEDNQRNLAHGHNLKLVSCMRTGPLLSRPSLKPKLL